MCTCECTNLDCTCKCKTKSHCQDISRMFLQRMHASKKKLITLQFALVFHICWMANLHVLNPPRMFSMQRFRVTICGVANQVSTLQSLFNMFCVTIPNGKTMPPTPTLQYILHELFNMNVYCHRLKWQTSLFFSGKLLNQGSVRWGSVVTIVVPCFFYLQGFLCQACPLGLILV